jgi:hypothetical protein
MCDTLSTAEEAINWFHEQCCGTKPNALGVDALTLWSTGPAGWRPADRALRAHYPDVRASITAPNSLYGAMPINGIAVALSLANDFTNLRITETHPKVLYYALTRSAYDFGLESVQMVENLLNRVAVACCAVTDDHAWDALASAFAAREWDKGRWSHDLHRLPSNQGERLIPAHASEAHYVWPEAVPQAPTEQQQAPRGNADVRDAGRGDRWKIAVERLERAGHDDVAQQVIEYRNARNERAGWDSWLKSSFPALWILVSKGD